MTECVPIRRRASSQHNLRGDQSPQLDRESFRGLSCYRAQQRRIEFPSNNRGDLSNLLCVGAEPIEARRQRRLQCLGDFAVFKAAAAVEGGFGKLLNEERNAAGTLADARDHVLRKRCAPGCTNYLHPLSTTEAAER